MYVVLAIFFAVIVVASLAGWVVDSRDGADWAPTENGHRARRRL